MRLIVLPHRATTPEEALDWFESQGAVDVRLWLAPDGSIRGVGRLP